MATTQDETWREVETQLSGGGEQLGYLLLTAGAMVEDASVAAVAARTSFD